MNIDNTAIYFNAKSFTGTSYAQRNASRVYKTLNPEFIEMTQKQGINKGTIVELLKRMVLSPKFEQQSVESICEQLSEKFKIILDAVSNGKTGKELQKLFRLPEQTINGLLFRQERLQRAKDVTELYKQGVSIKDITKKYGFRTETIRTYLKEQGITLENPYAPKHEAIIEMVKAGYCDTDIAQNLRANPNTVANVRKANQLKGNRKKGKVQAQQEEILKELESGKKRKDIAQKFGICKEMVDKIAEINGVYRKNVMKRDNKVIEMLNNGIAPKDIAKEIGISRATVLRIARKNSITLVKDFSERNQSIIEALKNNSIVNVAKIFGLSEQRVWAIKETFKS